MGRIDRQVKLRGFRIELSEIESRLSKIHGVKNCCVLVVNDLLIGFVTCVDGAEVCVPEAIQDLGAQIPHYMVPKDIVILEAFPLTPNSKIDVKKLKAMDVGGDLDSADEYVAPKTRTEGVIVDIFSDVLNIETMSATGDFFELGGHSVMAMKVISKLKEVSMVCTVADLFQARTAVKLANLLAESSYSEVLPEPMRIGAKTQLLSTSQERLWVLDTLNPGSSAYNVPIIVRFTHEDAIDVVGLQSSLESIIQRHQILRTVYIEDKDDVFQVVLDDSPQVKILREVADLQAFLNTEATTPFDLTKGVLRVHLIVESAKSIVMSFIAHHIAYDGASTSVLMQELNGHAGDLDYQYADYAYWERHTLVESGERARQLDWCITLLKGAPTVLDLPTDRPRPAVFTGKGASFTKCISSAVASRVRNTAKKFGCTEYHVYLSVFALLLGSCAKVDDILIAAPGENRPVPSLQKLIGFFVSTLVFRVNTSGCRSFKNLLEKTAKMASGVVSNQSAPFEDLVSEFAGGSDGSRPKLCQALLAYNPSERSNDMQLGNGLKIEPIAAEHTGAKFEVLLNVNGNQDGSMDVMWEYYSETFDEARIATMHDDFVALLDDMCNNPNKEIRRNVSKTPAPRGLPETSDDCENETHLEDVDNVHLAAIINIFSSVLPKGKITPASNFFNVGGTSVSAIKASRKINNYLKKHSSDARKVQVTDLYKYRSPVEVLRYAAPSLIDLEDSDKIENYLNGSWRLGGQTAFHLSPVQQVAFSLHSQNRDTLDQILSISIEVSNESIDHIRGATWALVGRHEILRGKVRVDVDSVFMDIQSVKRMQQHVSLMLKDAHSVEAIDIYKSVIHLCIVSQANNVHILYVDIHRIACSTCSLSIIKADFENLLAEKRTERPIQYADFGEHLLRKAHGDSLHESIVKAIAGAPSTLRLSRSCEARFI